jgi:tight adherence protein B
VIATVAAVATGVALTTTLARLAGRLDARSRARRLGDSRRALPPAVRRRIDAALLRSDIVADAELAVRVWGAAVAVAGWFAWLLAPALVVPAVVAALLAGPVVVLVRSGRADTRVRAALPSVLDHVVARLRAGGTVPESLLVLGERPGPLHGDLHSVSARLALGAPVEDALAAWTAVRPIPEVRATAGALTVVTTVGGPGAGALEGLAASLRDDAAASGDARALSAQARLSAVVVGVAPLAYVAFSAMTDPASARVLVATGAGRLCLVLGVALEAAGACWMRALVRA